MEYSILAHLDSEILRSGGYLEWWSACDNTKQKDEHGEMRLVYYLSDSPMSGINNCGVVYQNGRTERISLPYFISCWPIFIDINSRYDNAKKMVHPRIALVLSCSPSSSSVKYSSSL